MDEENTLLTNNEGDPQNDNTLLTDDPVETKVQEDNQDDNGKPEDDKSDKGKEGAPETYEDFTFPDNVEVDKDLLEQALPLFKELNLTQEQAQKLVDLQVAQAQKESEAQFEAWRKTMEDWATAAKDDKEFGGTAFNDNLATAKAAITAFGTDEFKNMLNFSGVGNHPEMIRFLYRVGKAVSDDKVLLGTNTSAPTDPAAILYPTMNK